MEFDTVTIMNLFNNCLFKKEELKNGAYTYKNCIESLGFAIKAYFDRQKLEENRENIIDLLNQINGLDEGIPILKIGYDENGVSRANAYSCELLMCLGLAIGEIEYVYPRESWDNLPNGLPIIKRKEKVISIEKRIK